MNFMKLESQRRAMILLGNSHKATAEDVAKAGGQTQRDRQETGKRIVYQHGGGQDMGVLADWN